MEMDRHLSIINVEIVTTRETGQQRLPIILISVFLVHSIKVSLLVIHVEQTILLSAL